MRDRIIDVFILLLLAAEIGAAQSARMSSPGYAIDRDAFVNAGGTSQDNLRLTHRLGTPHLSRMQGTKMIIGTTVRNRGAEKESLPAEYAFWGNFPNPFNERTMFRFDLPDADYVTLELYSILGQRLGLLLQDHLPAGRYEIAFDGRDEQGASLPSGVYFCRLSTKKFEKTQKLLILR